MNIHPTSDPNTDSSPRNSGRRSFIGTLGGLATAAAALPLLPAVAANRQQQSEAEPAPVNQPVQGNAFFD